MKYIIFIILSLISTSIFFGALELLFEFLQGLGLIWKIVSLVIIALLFAWRIMVLVPSLINGFLLLLVKDKSFGKGVLNSFNVIGAISTSVIIWQKSDLSTASIINNLIFTVILLIYINEVYKILAISANTQEVLASENRQKKP
ncbi:hypothetical protein SAMN05661096_00315 [Marivirga sericea]|uniref:Uncharacterized protein n=1 Tax=Marivirga sericea TaxID=1028 RepID=A0A1X7I8R6_9BACT|nr:hypothetical protein [Marivirga sericea]SMG10379.1 hypothetical protein SAMN05661096_00315 [Marivirga sericea]